MRKRVITQVIPAGILALALAMGSVFINSGNTAHAANSHSVDLEASSSNYLHAADSASLSMTRDISIEAWVRWESQPATDAFHDIVNKVPAGGHGYRLSYNDASGTKQISLHVGDAGVGDNFSYATTLSNGTWYHIAATWKASTRAFNLYINGSNVSSQTGSGPYSIEDVSNELRIGTDQSGSTYADGLIDEVRIWSIARTATEIADDYNKEINGNEVGLRAYWKFNNGETDSTGNGNTLTQNGSPLPSYVATMPFSGFAESLKVRKTANESVTSSTIPESDNHLKLSLAANTTYIIEGVILATSTSVTPDLMIAFHAQTGATVAIGYTTDESNEVVLTSGATSSPIALPANTPRAIHVKGTVVTSSTSGDLQLKWAQGISDSAPTTVLQGSYLKAESL